MARQLPQFRIFIAARGDVSTERNIAHGLIDKISLMILILKNTAR
jgi:hypothetical protein